MLFGEFKEQIEQTYHMYFPHSRCNAYVFHCLGNTIMIDCYLAENEHELTCGIWGNDMFSVSFGIDLPKNFDKETDEMPENLTMEKRSFCYMVKPENNYLYGSHVNVPYRKSKGDPVKLIKVFDKSMKKLYDSLIDSKKSGNIHDNFKDLLKFKI